MAGACHPFAVVSFLLSEDLEGDVVKNESDDELEGLTALFLEHERKPAVRIPGYKEEVESNLLDDCFKCNFCLRRGWLMKSQNIGKGGRAIVPSEKQLLLTLELLGNQIPFRSKLFRSCIFANFVLIL